MKFSYFPGCTLKTTGKDLETYAVKSAEALGFQMEELPEWQCCGAVYPQAKDEVATRLAAVWALAEAKRLGNDLITLCSACHHVIKRTNGDIAADEKFRTTVNNYLGADLQTPYEGETKVLHYLEVLRDVIGFEAVKEKVTKPLTGRKIGAYYGCLLLRPSKELRMDDPENPTVLEDLILAMGADPVYYGMRNECCGGYMAVENADYAAKNAGKIIDNAVASGVETIITACPLCYYNLKKNAEGRVEVLYFTELLAEALGVKE